jgi:hypothetical protein
MNDFLRIKNSQNLILQYNVAEKGFTSIYGIRHLMKVLLFFISIFFQAFWINYYY